MERVIRAAGDWLRTLEGDASRLAEVKDFFDEVYTDFIIEALYYRGDETQERARATFQHYQILSKRFLGLPDLIIPEHPEPETQKKDARIRVQSQWTPAQTQQYSTVTMAQFASGKSSFVPVPNSGSLNHDGQFGKIKQEICDPQYEEPKVCKTATSVACTWAFFYTRMFPGEKRNTDF